MKACLFPSLLFSPQHRFLLQHIIFFLEPSHHTDGFMKGIYFLLCRELTVRSFSYTNRQRVYCRWVSYPGSFLAVGSREPRETTRALSIRGQDITEGNREGRWMGQGVHEDEASSCTVFLCTLAPSLQLNSAVSQLTPGALHQIEGIFLTSLREVNTSLFVIVVFLFHMKSTFVELFFFFYISKRIYQTHSPHSGTTFLKQAE